MMFVLTGFTGCLDSEEEETPKEKLIIAYEIKEDYTNPEDYEDATEKFKHFDETADLKEVTTDEETFRKWDGLEEDWEDFNKKSGGDK